MASLGWGGYLRPDVPEDKRKVLNGLLEKGKEPAFPMDFLFKEFLNNGFSLKLTAYGDSFQFTAMNDTDHGDGMRYGISAYAEGSHIALLVLYFKLEGLNWTVPGEAGPPDRKSAWG